MSTIPSNERLAAALAASSQQTFVVEQHAHSSSRMSDETAILVGWLHEGTTRGLSVRHDGEEAPVWFEQGRTAVDLSAWADRLPLPIREALPGIELGPTRWNSTVGLADRAAHELIGHVTNGGWISDPGRWLPAVAELASSFEDNPEQPGSLVASVPAGQWCSLIGMAASAFDDIVRRVLMGLGAPPDDPAIARLWSGQKPSVASVPATVALGFGGDGLAVVQVAVDVTGWMTEVHPGFADRGNDHPLMVVMWQTFVPDGEPVADAPRFPEAAIDQTAALLSLRGEPAEPKSRRGAVAGPVTADPAMVDDLRGQSGAMYFVLRDAAPSADAAAALRAMVEAVQGVRHPDEPSDALASFTSDVMLTADGGWFLADISDMEEETEVLNELVQVALGAANDHLDGGELSARPPESSNDSS